MTSELIRRSAPTVFGSSGGRTRRATITTGDLVEVYDRSQRAIVREALLPSGAILPTSVPLLTDHDRSVTTLAGSASGFRVDGNAIEADLSFASGVPAADQAFALVEQRHLTAVSIGYRVMEAHELRAGESESVNGRTYVGPCRLATRWKLFEVSLVPIGADPAATIQNRSFNSVSERSPMPTLQTNQASDCSNLSLVEYCRAHIRGKTREEIDNPRDVLQRFLSLDGLADLQGRINTAVVTGYSGASDSTAGWATVQSLPNFLESRLGVVTTPAVALRLARGDQAAPTVLSTEYQAWRLSRVAVSFQLDEQDFIDGNGTLDVVQLVLREAGAAMKRCVLDACFGRILANDNLSDGGAAFSVARGNLIDVGPLGLTNLKKAWGFIADTNREVDNVAYIHDNLTPAYLITAPNSYLSAVEIVTDIADASPVVQARSESRLGDKPFLDPMTDTVRSGGETYWLLSAPASQHAGLVIGFLNGRTAPQVRTYKLPMGQWGIGVDLVLDFGCTIVSSSGMVLGIGV
jgi:phage head maturation protease